MFSTDKDEWGRYFDPWILHGQAEIQDSIGEAKYDIAETVSDRASELLQAAARNDVVAQANFTAAADRLAGAERSISGHVAHGVEVLLQGQIKEQIVLGDVRKELQEVERTICDRQGAFELGLQRWLCDFRDRNSEQHCEIKELVRAEGAATRQAFADYRMQDLRDQNLRLQLRLDKLDCPTVGR